jgi:hypothetical protein
VERTDAVTAVAVGGISAPGAVCAAGGAGIRIAFSGGCARVSGLFNDLVAVEHHFGFMPFAEKGHRISFAWSGQHGILGPPQLSLGERSAPGRQGFKLATRRKHFSRNACVRFWATKWCYERCIDDLDGEIPAALDEASIYPGDKGHL